MKLYIKNKFASITGKSVVLDENKNPVYKVKGRLFSFTKKKKIYDLEKNKLYTVRNKYWHFFMHSAFVYDSEGTKILKLSQKFKFGIKFVVEGYQDEIKIEGSPFRFNCSVYKNDKLIGNLYKKYFAMVDSYELDIEDDEKENAPLFVAIVIALDNIKDRNFK